MEIFIRDAGAQDLLEAIDEAPFSPAFREAFSREVLATVGMRQPRLGFDGFFDSRDVTALPTGDWCVRVGLTSGGKTLAAALRALTATAKIER